MLGTIAGKDRRRTRGRIAATDQGMGELLDALHRLQVVELQLAAVRRNRETKARRAEVAQRQVRQIDERLHDYQRLVRERQIRIDALNLEVASREQSITRHREGLNKAKTNKDYSAILAAMNTEKADNMKVENQVLAIMEEMQKLKNELGNIEAERAKLFAGVTAAQQALDDYDASVAAKKEALLAERESCAQAIAPGTLASFLRVAERHDGEAMAAVTKLHPKRDDYICSGCNMTVVLDVINYLKTRDELQLCKSCGRILFLEPSPARS
ncbi:MAG: hypothetical protein HY763_11530 [Planctomycetes bacterium]|nr:hypothetical protein [Planctomycetota bacterium]